jgi:hypothetical protein
VLPHVVRNWPIFLVRQHESPKARLGEARLEAIRFDPRARLKYGEAVRALARLLACVACTLALLVATPARAADPQVAILVEGPGAEAARGHIAALLPKSASAVDGRAFAHALEGAGQKGPFGRALAPNAPRDRVVTVAKGAGAAVHADAVILGRVVKTGKNLDLTVVYVDVARGEVLADRTVPIGKRDDTAALRPVLGPPLDKLGAAPLAGKPPEPPAPTPPDAPPPAEPAASPADARDAPPTAARGATHDVGTELFELGAALDVGGRRFDYKDPLPEQAGALRSHSIFGMVGLAVSGSVYPLALSGTKILRDLGVTFDGSHAFGVTSKLQGGTQVGSTYDRYDIGLRGRFRTGGPTAPVVGVGGGYARRTFGFAATPPNLDGSLAAVSYSQLRGGLDARFPVRIAAIVVGADYLAPLSAGIVEGRFRGASVGGIDARVGVSVRLVASIEARFLASYARYFYSFKPAVGDPYVAGGALDEFFSLALGAAYVF